jgi:hypothetical protein
MIRTFKSNEAVKFVKIDGTEEGLILGLLREHISYVDKYLCPGWADRTGEDSPEAYIKSVRKLMGETPGGWAMAYTNKRGVRQIQILESWPDESSDFFRDYDEVTND